MQMTAKQRQQRPAELGPYPLECLHRDASIIAEESAKARATPNTNTQTKKTAANLALLNACNKYHEVFSEIRDVSAFAKKAPLPDDPALKVKDVKGAAYFLDASQVAICALPKNAWLAEADVESIQQYAIVLLVEHAQAIDNDNLAATWVNGLDANVCDIRAAEIALSLSGYIAALGFDAKAHWQGASDVDLERLAVLSGLAERNGESLLNPFLQQRFSIAAISTSYELAIDLPLQKYNSKPATFSARNFFGINGAVSGVERWRRSRRPSHLGHYAVETLKRVEKPTTLIIDDEVKRSPSRAMFYIRAEKGDLGPKAQKQRPRWAYKHPLAQGMLRLMWPMASQQDGVVNPQATPAIDLLENSKAVKAFSHYLGAAITGICEIPDYCWYSHRKDGTPITPYHRYAVVMLIDQGQETVEGACGDDWISGSQSMRAYMRGAEVAGLMSETLRQQGHSARPHSNLESDVLHVPLVLLAGLGEQSRIGESAVNPFLGPRFKTVVMTTDMPLEVDQAIDFGLQTFCSSCQKCARECPCQAIPFGDKVMYNGYETWKPDSDRCTRYRITNLKGSACGRCVKTCPLTKDITWDGPWLTRIGSWAGINLHWLKPYLAPAAIWLDDKLGHGNPVDAKKWWLDLEVAGEQCHTFDPNNYCVEVKGSNRRMIDPSRSAPSQQKIAFYPPEVMPPPIAEYAVPADRAKGLLIASDAETVDEAKARLATAAIFAKCNNELTQTH